MNFTLSAVAKAMLPVCSAVVIMGCNSNDNHTPDGYFDTTNPPAIDITLPATDGPQAALPESGAVPQPVKAADNEAVIYLVEKAGNTAGADIFSSAAKDYAQYSLHVWNNGTCDRAGVENGAWDNVSIKPAGVDELGPYWRLPLKDGDTDCLNFIVRDDKVNNLSGSDAKLVFSEIPDRTASYLSGSTKAYDERGDAYVQLFGIANAEAHLVSSHLLLWDGVEQAEEVRLYVSLDGQLQPNDKGHYAAEYAVLTPIALPANVKTAQPHLAGKTAYAIDGDIDMRTIMKAQMAVLAVDAAGTVINGTQVQPAAAFDQLFAAAANDIVLGATIEDKGTQFAVWAPSAQNVVAVLFDNDKNELGRLQMAYDEASGVWSLLTDKAPSGTYYRYLVDVYHPVSGKVEHYQVTDPYSLSLSMNSTFSQVIDLNDPALKPDGWDDLKRPVAQTNPAEFVIYEAHVRDFSALDASTPEADRGKFSAFTQRDTVPVKHLKSLSENGVTHLHLLPIFDIASINENPDEVANIDEPFSKLCQVNRDVASSPFGQYCESGLLISEVFDRVAEGDTEKNPAVQALNRFVSSSDSFNWGYDPFHYTVPEGSYARNAEGPQRIKELREAVMAVKQDIGMNVVMDVVYNHTNAAGPDARTSVLDKLVPWYYQRLNPMTGNVENSTCCSNTAPERAMFEKLISDSLVVWSRDYKIDAYRFDLMGHHPLSQMQRSLQAVQKVDPQTYFYGEGWNFGEVQNDALFVQATQPHLGGTGIGSFSDRLRDAVRGGSPFDGGNTLRETQGFGNGAYVMPNEISTVTLDNALHLADLTRLGMAGNLKAFTLIDATGNAIKGEDMKYSGQAAGYAEDPSEIQNYVSKHDNQTLWDNNQYKIGYEVPMETRVRMQVVSLATAMLGQGMPFTHMGSELLRSKSMQRDSYDSGDRYNLVDFTLQDNNWDKGLPRQDKDGSNYALIENVIANTGSKAIPAQADMATMVTYYQELARLRQTYPLITLGKGEEVIKRVDFHNTGKDQIPGLIVMSIDNGNTSGADVDSTLDGLVIVINATNTEQQIPWATSLQRSAQHTSSLAAGARFAEGKMQVPAWTPVVFELPRAASGRAAGIPVTAK